MIIWSFFQPFVASVVFFICIGLLEGYLLFLNNSGKPLIKNQGELNDNENMVLKKYHIYFYYPFTASSLSSTLSLIQITTFIIVPWLLYKHIWIQAVLIGLNWFPSALLSRILNPMFFLHNAVEKKENEMLREEMLAVDSVCEKIIELQKVDSETEE